MLDNAPLLAPLTPPDCSSYGYMPLNIDRLHKSRAWLICKRRPELFFYMHNLWTTAWKETPAASLENDEDWLADKACCPFDLWPQVREDVMRGFVLCSDGRWYHELIAVYALEAWLFKLGSRITSGHGNAKKNERTFDDSNLRDQVVMAARMLFALDPNSQYFEKRRGVLAAIVGDDKAKKAPRARKPKAPKPAPDQGSSGSPDGSPGGAPSGDKRDPEPGLSGSHSTVLNPTVLVGGKPPTTPGADAPGVPDALPTGEEPAASHLMTTRGTPAPGRIEMADYAMPLPDWLVPHAEAWNAFQEVRRKKNAKAPYTANAQRLIVRDLKKFFDEGQDLTAILTASATAGWTGVFPQKGARRAPTASFTGKNYSGGELERDFGH